MQQMDAANAPVPSTTHQSSGNLLPPLMPKGANYYLAHSIDLSQPDYVHVFIQDGVPTLQQAVRKPNVKLAIDPR